MVRVIVVEASTTTPEERILDTRDFETTDEALAFCSIMNNDPDNRFADWEVYATVSEDYED